MPTEKPANCEICGEPMPDGEEMFNYHGYSGSCPKPPIAASPAEPQPAGDAHYGHTPKAPNAIEEADRLIARMAAAQPAGETRQRVLVVDTPLGRAVAATAPVPPQAPTYNEWIPVKEKEPPKDGREVLLLVKYRAGIPNGRLVGHWQRGGHCIQDHPPIDAGWYFWNGVMFDKASEPTHWLPLPDEKAVPPQAGDDAERLESPDYELCDNQNNHPQHCHCFDPLYWKKRATAAESKNAKLRERLRITAIFAPHNHQFSGDFTVGCPKCEAERLLGKE